MYFPAPHISRNAQNNDCYRDIERNIFQHDIHTVDIYRERLVVD